MVMKQLPGADAVYMVYDKRDRLVLTQDGNLRTGNKWMFTKYDALNRPVMTGIYDHGVNIDQDSMQSIIDTVSIFYETFDVTQEHAYQINSYPNTNLDILTVTYYDTYDFDQDGHRTFMTNINTNDFLLSEINEQVKGQITGTKTRILGTDQFITNITLYDDKYRVIRTYQENYLGGNDLLLTKYDFVGNVKKTRQVHVKSAGATPITIDQRFEHDHAFRLDSAFHEIDGNGEVCIAVMEYNELGQLISKKLHEGLQDVNYQYNIRGWLTMINDPALMGDDLFAMQLAYNDVITGLTTTPQFNGNISAITWKNSEELSDHSYTFNYDNANRITKGDHFNGITATTEFDLNKVSYDKNGNIDTLIRYGASGLIDNLTYTYTDASSNYTNQLQQVDDATGNTGGFADVPGLDYAYDNNGNLIEDYNKSIENISYNYLNLPQRIWFGNGDSITYIYDAAGVKHAKLIDGSETGDRYYIGNMEYNQTQTLEYIHTSEGRVRYNGVDYAYDYYLKDHLGNTRVSFTESATIPGQAEALQVDNYYPFGMRFNQAPILQVEENNYLYNGKELQKNYRLDWYDYGARYYNAALGRWMCIDPLTEKYFNESPYVYVGNNPIMFIDPDGKIKIKVSVSAKMTTGQIGVEAKAFGVNVGGSYSAGGAEQEVTIYATYDTKTKEFTFGASHTQRYVEEGSGSIQVGALKGGESSEREIVTDVNTKDGFTQTEDKVYKDKSTGGVGPVSTEETEDGVAVKTDLGASGEVNALIVGAGAALGIELTKSETNTNTSISTNTGTNTSTTTKTEEKKEL